MPKLTDTKIRSAILSATKSGQGFKLYDERELYLILVPREKSCGCWWRQDYVWEGKDQTLSVGVYPKIGLAAARQRGAEIRAQVASRIDPSAARKQEKISRRKATANTFEAVTLEWLARTGKTREWTADHIERVKRRFENHFFPWLGAKPIADITDDDILGCLRRMEGEQLIDTARRGLSEIDSIFRYGMRLKLLKRNIVAELRGPETLPTVKVKHHAALIDPTQVGGLLRSIDAYHGGFVVRCALRFLPLVFVRPGELQGAVWSEINLDDAEWRIPAERMKMREQHIVPLSTQAVAILRELHSLTGPDGYVFPQARNASRPISENTVNVALRACGYTKDQQTAHGFRSTASTLLNEQQFNKDWIERQLAHGERDKSRGSYNSAEYLPQRRKMMQSWADYLDTLRKGGGSADRQ